MHISLGPMDLITDIIQQVGLDVAYEHDDLVFVSRNAFILKFTENTHHIDLYFNEDLKEQDAQALMAEVSEAGGVYGLQFSYKGAFCFTQKKAEETIRLEFFDLVGQQ
jgi:hypothetical protein